MGVELPLCVVVTILECCVMFSGVKLSIRSFVLFQMEESFQKTIMDEISNLKKALDKSSLS